MAGKNFEAFKKTIEREFMAHPAVTKNEYTAWFSHGDVPLDHLRDFTVQFSVFSNLFLLAALNRVINADTLHAARESKEILMNELGVIYNKSGQGGQGGQDRQGRQGEHGGKGRKGGSGGADIPGGGPGSNTDRESDPALDATEG